LLPGTKSESVYHEKFPALCTALAVIQNFSGSPEKDGDGTEGWAPPVHPEMLYVIKTQRGKGYATHGRGVRMYLPFVVYVVSTGWPRGLEVVFHC